MGEVAEEEEEAGGLVPLEPPERRLVLLLERGLVLEAGGRALDRVVVLAAERAAEGFAVVAAGALDFTALVFGEPVAAAGGGLTGVGAGVGVALLASPAPSEAADLPVDRVVGVAMAGRGGTGTGRDQQTGRPDGSSCRSVS